jgi:hypothetical protein
LKKTVNFTGRQNLWGYKVCNTFHVWIFLLIIR